MFILQSFFLSNCEKLVGSFLFDVFVIFSFTRASFFFFFFFFLSFTSTLILFFSLECGIMLIFLIRKHKKRTNNENNRYLPWSWLLQFIFNQLFFHFVHLFIVSLVLFFSQKIYSFIR